MTDIMFPELQTLRIEMSDETRDAHFQAIVAALGDSTYQTDPVVSPWRVAWRRRVAAFATIGVALVPAAAVASESAVPGDLLYGVKLSVERIQVIFDTDIDAEHRVDELETLIERDAEPAVVDRLAADTRDVLQETSDRPDLLERYDTAITRDSRHRDGRPGSGDTPPVGDKPLDRDNTTTTIQDRHRESTSTTSLKERDGTTTTISDRQRETTTTPHRGDTTTTIPSDAGGSGDQP